MSERKYLVCKKCGKMHTVIKDSKCPTMCCGQVMTALIPNTVGAEEKHAPVAELTANTVKVKIGAVTHPMEEAHYIEWIYLQTERGGQCKCLKPGEAPEVEFTLTDDKATAVYAYCNLHGLWITKL